MFGQDRLPLSKWTLLITISIVCLFNSSFILGIGAENVSDSSIMYLHPNNSAVLHHKIVMHQGELNVVQLNVTVCAYHLSRLSTDASVNLMSEKSYIVTFPSAPQVTMHALNDSQCSNNSGISFQLVGSFSLYANILGISNVVVSVDQYNVLQYPVDVLRRHELAERLFVIFAVILVVLLTFALGAALDPKVIFSYLRRPIAPGIGFSCQYLMMPLTSLALGKLIPIDNATAFGLLTIGCSPGGGSSNIFCLLLQGDLNLSMTMTFLSTVAAFGMMPLWIFALGRFYLDANSVTIPYWHIALDTLLVVVPVLCGLLLRWRYPNHAARLYFFAGPLAIIFIFYMLTFGSYVNWYIFRMLYYQPMLLLAAALLPCFGFLFGALIAILCKQSRPQVVTIALETGIQNIGIPILILIYTMPQPQGDMGAIMPVTVGMFTPVPLFVWFLARCAHKRYGKTMHTSGQSINTPVDTQEIQFLSLPTNENHPVVTLSKCNGKASSAHMI